uniref:Quinone oxidoreductase n=1 Tax=Cacopsylla melanoneura TaxID=428564 RepID=A0A8D9EFJ7_9HEMI
MVRLFLTLLACWVADQGFAKQPGQYANVLREFGGPEKFITEDMWPIPEDFAPDECWVLVKAAAVYPWDKYARHNNGTRKKLKTPVVIGQEVSGIVIQCGKNVTHIKQAERVFAKMPNYEGGYKQIVLLKGSETFPLPENFTHEEGAVSYYPFMVAHKALIKRAQITRGKSILIIGGNRDVGAAAIQIAKAHGMYPIIATAGTEEAKQYCKDRGADHVVDHNLDAFRSIAVAANGHTKFDVIFNARYPNDHEEDVDFAKSPGGYCLYHDLRDIEKETHGFPETKLAEHNESMQHILHGFNSGQYRPYVNKTFYLDQIDEAHREVDDPDVIGDVVLTKVHRDDYIHLSNCENRVAGHNLSRPVTLLGTINWSDTPPNLKIANYRFNFTPANSAEQNSISQYIWTLAVEELYGGSTPLTTTDHVTYSFESLYSSAEFESSAHGQYDAKEVHEVIDKKGGLLKNMTTTTDDGEYNLWNKTYEEQRKQRLAEGLKKRRRRNVLVASKKKKKIGTQ